MGSFLSKQLKGDRIIWMILIVLMLVSALAMFSASSGLAYDHKYKSHFLAPITQHVFYLLLGLVAAYFAHLLAPKWIFFLGGVGYLISFPLLIYVLIKGQSENGAARWIHLPFFNLQPSEVAKISVVLMLCSAMGYYQKKRGDVNLGFKTYIGIVALPAILILMENLSTFLLLCIVSFILLFIGGVSLKKLGKLVAGLVAAMILFMGVAFFVSKCAPDESGLKVENTKKESKQSFIVAGLSKITHRSGTWVNRVKEFVGSDLTPEEKEKKKFSIVDKQQQTGHAHIAVARGKWFGVGIGNSEERDFIPQSYADFIFAVIVEEVGVLGMAIVLLYLALFYRSCVILNKSDGYSGAFAAVGLSCLIVIQAFMHIAVVLGFMPVTGQPLPIISRGGTSAIMTCAYFGVILALSRNLKDEADSKKQTSRKSSEEKVAKNDKELAEVNAAPIVSD